LRVLKYLTGELGLTEDVKNRWYQHWIAEGFRGLEGLLTDHPGTGKYCHGNTPGLADICLVPQVFNARRFDCDLTPYPTVVRIADSLNELPAFADAAPEKQPDAA
ncbi:MAG: maleylacetoacetate isomerase, partial [Minwuiales bacterium]|nr:maleylacetoacetate isomerase [Minwuiales bacterium]